MAFTYDLSTDIGVVRLELGDTNAQAYTFEDNEITHFLTSGGSTTGAVQQALMTLLRTKSYRMKHAKSMGVMYDDTEQYKAIEAALKLTGWLPSVSVTFPALLPSDAGYVESTTS